MKAPKDKNATYYCFNENGECNLPSKTEIKNLKTKGIEPIVFLDSNVCLNIIKIVDKGRNATNCNKNKVFKLKEYLDKTGIEIHGLFGLMELCQKEGILDTQKMTDFKLRLDFFKQIPLKYFKRFDYEFDRDFILYDTPNFKENNNWYGLEEKILFSYCSLLKIREIGLRKGVSKKNAIPNIKEYTYWMRNELGLMFGMEYKLAIAIFGGITEFRKMVCLEGKKSSAKKTLMGTVWDFTHARFCMSNLKISEVLGGSINAFFLTNDKNLFKLINRFNLSMYLENGDKKPTIVYTSDFDYPHLDSEFCNFQLKESFDLMYKGIKQEFKFNREKIKKQIHELELSNDLLD